MQFTYGIVIESNLILCPVFASTHSAQAFEECLNIDKSLFSKEKVADFDFLRMFKDSLRLEFGRKRCQKKRKDLSNQIL